jgi:hypothetical protein
MDSLPTLPETLASTAQDAALPAPKLLTRLRDNLRTRRYSIRTEATYIDWVRRFGAFL